MMNRPLSWIAAISVVMSGCDAPAPPPSTGGTDVAAGPCGRGVVVLESDYQSTNVGLVGFDGAVLSSSLVSSGSAQTGLSAPFSGDVVVPTMPAASDRVVLLDRYPAGVITWVEVTTGAVTAQLPVNQGFAANPQDYAELGPHKAYVSRLQPNPSPGKAAFDGGSDVLVIDPAAPAITGRIDLAPAMQGESPEFYPRPNRIVIDGDRAIVLLSAYALSFTASAPSRLVVIDTATDAIVSVRVLDGMHGCTGLGRAPGGGRVAVACSGTFQNDVSAALPEAGLVVLARHGDMLEEEARFPAEAFGAGPLGFSVAFAAEDTVFFTTFGHDATDGAEPLDDTAVALNVKSGDHEVLLRSHGTPFTLGEVRCASACGACFVADAGTGGGVVQRLTTQGGAVTPDRAIHVETTIGLSPRYVGQF